jgi:hypothetical protein
MASESAGVMIRERRVTRASPGEAPVADLMRPDQERYRYRLTRSGRCDLQNRRRVEPGVSSAVPTAVAVRGSIS